MVIGKGPYLQLVASFPAVSPPALPPFVVPVLPSRTRRTQVVNLLLDKRPPRLGFEFRPRARANGRARQTPQDALVPRRRVQLRLYKKRVSLESGVLRDVYEQTGRVIRPNSALVMSVAVASIGKWY